MVGIPQNLQLNAGNFCETLRVLRNITHSTDAVTAGSNQVTTDAPFVLVSLVSDFVVIEVEPINTQPAITISN